MFTVQEQQRYRRQIQLPEVGLEGQKRLQKAKVLCVGVGGLGSPLSLYLAACGVGILGLMDADNVALANLHRQILYRTEEVGQSKVHLAKAQLEAINPHCQITTHNEFLSLNNAIEIISAYDIVADCSDNFKTRCLVSDTCVALDKPSVMASVEKFQGQLAIFPGKIGASYCSVFENIDKASAPTCNQAGVLGVAPGVIGTLQANEILKMILNRSDCSDSQLILINLLDLSIKKIKLCSDIATTL